MNTLINIWVTFSTYANLEGKIYAYDIKHYNFQDDALKILNERKFVNGEQNIFALPLEGFLNGYKLTGEKI